MSINPTIPTTEAVLTDHDQIVGDQNIGTSGTTGNSHYIPLDECQCTICTEYFINAVETNCHHRFCNFCIHRWFRSNGRRQCPTCRCNVTHLNPLPSLDNSIQRMILSLSGDQIQERERIRSRRHHTDHRARGRNATSSRPYVFMQPLATATTNEDSASAPILTLPTARPTNPNGNPPPGNNNSPNSELPDATSAPTNANRTYGETSSSNRRYIDEMTDTMNEYEYHLARAQAAHRRMVQARSDYEIQENRLHTLFNRFVTLSAAAEANYEADRTNNTNVSVNDGSYLIDSDLDDFAMTPNSRPSTLGLGPMSNQRLPPDIYASFDNPRPTRGQMRYAPRGIGIGSSLITPPPFLEQSRVDTSVATTERLEPGERSRGAASPYLRELRTARMSTATPLTSAVRRPTLTDVITLRNDITRNANLTRASYDRHVSLRRAMSMNRRRLDQLRDERNRFQVQVDRLEAQTIGNSTSGNSSTLRENDNTTNRENDNAANRENERIRNRDIRRSTYFTRTDQDITRNLATPNTHRMDEVNDMWDHFRARILREQPQLPESDSDDAEQPSQDNDVEELASHSAQEDGDPDSDPELRIEFRTPTMTLKMTNFSQK